jgi:formate dehydrogenase subunit gamma
LQQIGADVTASAPTAAAAWDAPTLMRILARHAGQGGALLPILHDVMEAFGFVPRDAEPHIAEALTLSKAEVRGVVSFYHDFRAAPAGQHVLKLCRAEACQAVGATALAQRALAKAGITWGETTPDGALTIEPTYCLGLCACGPAALMDGEPLALLDEPAMDHLLAHARGAAA